MPKPPIKQVAGELLPKRSGKTVLMQQLLNAHLDAGHKVLVISSKGSAVHQRHKTHKHLTIITPVSK